MPSLEPRGIAQRETADVAAHATVLHADQECLVITGIHSVDRRTFDPGGTFGEDRGTRPTRSPRDPFELVHLVPGQLTEVGSDLPLVRAKEMEAQTRGSIGPCRTCG